ncbi:hypothetical protein [Klebsiella pneumoniae]|uniref:hypothetical protein n=3 Tax=Klebsiella pneumoniae TaxID=573 RepID=UPI00296415C0|nr:hypothetical protein [Klebsiella pneumoniae]MDW1179584.1 hypothetical protein [Klebsiella pneumoniae]
MIGLFSKHWTTNFDGGEIPPWLTISSGAVNSAATGPWGGLTLTRPETTGSKLVFGSAIASSKETGIELDCTVNGFTTGKGTFIAGFFSDTDGWFLRTSGDICSLVFRKGGVETTKNVYLQFTGWSKMYPLKLEWDIRNKRLNVFRGEGAAYLSLDHLDVGNAIGTRPTVGWLTSSVGEQNTVASLSITRHFM